MGTAVVAVAGTLLGGLLQFAINDWRARRDRRRQTLVDAVRAVLHAATTLRRHQYLKVVARRPGGTGDSDEARRERYEARSELSDAIDDLALTTSDRQVRAAAEELFEAVKALSDAESQDQVDAAGERARQAHAALRRTGAEAIHH